jgi:hypothetical protein
LKRLEVFYASWKVREIRETLEAARERGDEAEITRIHDSFSYRMHDLSEFIEFKRTHL